MKDRELDEVYIERQEVGEHPFDGWTKLFGKLFYIEGSTFVYETGIETDEYGRKMWIETESELHLESVSSGLDCEVQHNDLISILKAKL